MSTLYYPSFTFGIGDYPLIDGLFSPKKDLKIYNVLSTTRINKKLLSDMYSFEDNLIKNYQSYYVSCLHVTNNVTDLLSNDNKGIPEYYITTTNNYLDSYLNNPDLLGYIRSITPSMNGGWDLWCYLFFSKNTDINTLGEYLHSIYEKINTSLDNRFTLSFDKLNDRNIVLPVNKDLISYRNLLRFHLKLVSYVNDITSDYTRYTGFSNYITIIPSK